MSKSFTIEYNLTQKKTTITFQKYTPIVLTTEKLKTTS